MTKVSVWGKKGEQPQIMKIQFSYHLNIMGGLEQTALNPSDYDNVQLLRRKGHSGFDIIMAWDDGLAPYIYVGHWNEGVV